MARGRSRGRRQREGAALARRTLVKIWVDDREGNVPKCSQRVPRHHRRSARHGMEVLAHLGRTSALADAKDLLQAGVDGFVHLVRDRDVDNAYLALVKSHPKVWSGPNMPVPMTSDTADALADTLPANQIATMRAQLKQRQASGNPPNELFELHCRNLRQVHDAGMVIGLGTDGTGDGIGVHEQMAAYTQCGRRRGGTSRARAQREALLWSDGTIAASKRRFKC